jgi:hypothetical protein
MIEDMEIFQEALEEINELTDSIIDGFIETARDNDGGEASDKMYETLMRHIHSVKGALGMIGLENHMRAVHASESFLIETYKKVKFTPGVLDLMIDFWSKLQVALRNAENPDSDLSHFSECYNCLKRSDYNSVCRNHFSGVTKCADLVEAKWPEPKAAVKPGLKISITAETEVEKKIIIIGADEFLPATLSRHAKEFYHYSCINEVYRKMPLPKLRGIKTIFIDLSRLNTNPFLLLAVLKQLKLPIKCCYIVDDKDELLKYLDEIYELSSFCVLSRKSANLELEILSMAG